MVNLKNKQSYNIKVNFAFLFELYNPSPEGFFNVCYTKTKQKGFQTKHVWNIVDQHEAFWSFTKKSCLVVLLFFFAALFLVKCEEMRSNESKRNDFKK